MRKFLFLQLFFLVYANIYAQQKTLIPLEGVVTVQNSCVNTGITEYASDVSIEHPNAKPTSTDSKGKFRLYISDIESGKQINIEVVPKGKYLNYVVVNEWGIKDLTLGRLIPVSIYICNKAELDRRKAELVGINVKKYNERVDGKIAQLKKRIAALEETNDYINEQYQNALDTLAILNKDRSESIKRIKEYAERLTLINLDEVDSIYLHAYRLFERGEVDSVAVFLQKSIDYEKEATAIRNQIAQAKQKQEIAQTIQATAELELDNAYKAKENLIKSLNLSAEANRLRFEYQLACQEYERILKLDSLNIQARKSLAAILLDDIGAAVDAKFHYLYMFNAYLAHIVVPDLFDYLDCLINLARCFEKTGSNSQVDLKLLQIVRESILETIQSVDDAGGFSLYLDGSMTVYTALLEVNVLIKNLLIKQQRYNEALNIAFQNVQLLERFKYVSSLYWAYNIVAEVYLAMKEYEKAEEYLIKALEMCNDTTCSYNTWDNLAQLYEAKGDFTTAINYKTKVLSLANEDFKKNVRRELVAYTGLLLEIADLEGKNGNLDLSKRYLLQADSLFNSQEGYIKGLGNRGEEYIIQHSVIKYKLAAHYEKIGEIGQAQNCLNDAFDLLSPMQDQSINLHLRYICWFVRVSEFYIRQKKTDKAEANLIHAKELIEAKTDSASFGVKTDIYAKLGILYEQKGDDQKFIVYTKKAVELYSQLHNNDSPTNYKSRATLLENVARKLDAQKEYEQALVYHQQSIELWELSGDNVELAIELNNYSVNQVYRKAYPEATATVQRSLALLIEHAPRSSYYVTALSNMSNYQLYTKNFTYAQKCAEEALAIDGDRKATKINLANALLMQGKYDAAWEIYRAVVSTVAVTTKDKTTDVDFTEVLERLMSEKLIPAQHLQEVQKVISYFTPKSGQ